MRGSTSAKSSKKKMQAQFTELSLDEPYTRVLERFGVNYEFYEDGAVNITWVHADLSDELYERDLDASELKRRNYNEH